MIVSCPSCSTSYRHEAAAAARTAICSQCDEQFPLTTARRRYIVLPPSAAGSAGARTPMPVGMDDPRLAPQIAAGAGPDTAGAPGAPPVAAFEATESHPPVEAVPVPDDAPAPEREAEPGPAEAVGSSVRDTVVVLVHAVIGAGAFYLASPQGSVSAVSWAAVGGAAGLLMGWAWIRWVANKD